MKVHTQFFSLSRLSAIDVKWVGKYGGGARERHLAAYEHSNPYFELIVITDGTVCLRVEEENMELVSGDILLLKPWDRHQEWRNSGKDIAFFWVQFAINPEPGYFNTNPILHGEHRINQLFKQDLRTSSMANPDSLMIPGRCSASRKYELFMMFEKLLTESETPRGYYRFRSTLLLGQILELIAEDVVNRMKADTSIPATFITYRDMVSFLNENYPDQNRVTREKLERRYKHDYEYLCQVFKKYAGISMVTYIHQLRIQRAKYLLHNSGKTIQAIAEEVGFSDPYYFSKVFKKIENQSPSKFRQ